MKRSRCPDERQSAAVDVDMNKDKPTDDGSTATSKRRVVEKSINQTAASSLDSAKPAVEKKTTPTKGSEDPAAKIQNTLDEKSLAPFMLTKIAAEAKYRMFPGFVIESKAIYDSLCPTPSFLLPKGLSIKFLGADGSSTTPFEHQYDGFCTFPIIITGVGGSGKTVSAARLGNQIYDACWMKSRKLEGSMNPWNVIGVYIRPSSSSDEADSGEKAVYCLSLNDKHCTGDLETCPNVGAIINRIATSVIKSLSEIGAPRGDGAAPWSLAGLHLLVVLDEFGLERNLTCEITKNYSAFQQLVRSRLESFPSSPRLTGVFPLDSATTSAARSGLGITVALTGRGVGDSQVCAPYLYVWL